jgi:hypothetical protein
MKKSTCQKTVKIKRNTRPTRQAMYVQRNTEERSCNRGCSGKAKRITYCGYVSVALSMQHVERSAVLYRMGYEKVARVRSTA